MIAVLIGFNDLRVLAQMEHRLVRLRQSTNGDEKVNLLYKMYNLMTGHA